MTCQRCGLELVNGRRYCPACSPRKTDSLTDKELVERTARRLGEDPQRRWSHFKYLCRKHQGSEYRPTE